MSSAKYQYPEYSSHFALEEAMLAYWAKDKTFEKSLAKNDADNIFSFYDGPPFITGMPHYGTLLPSIAKDVIPRFQTMRGKTVRRVWGWDVHGLPAENKVEQELGLKSKKDIEALGVDKFVAACREYVANTSSAWRWYIDHIGRWTELENAYRTDQLSFMESVIWAFKELYQKKLIYKGKRVSLYCPRCATPLSKFEVTMDEGNYRDVEDQTVTVAFKLLDRDEYVLAWTTTPWTLPANMALAVDEKVEYVRVSDGHKTYILAHAALERYQDGSLQVLSYLSGAELIGARYQPLYSFTSTNPETDHRVYSADFVTMTDGTGVVHIAPGFGEEDTELGEKIGLSMAETLDENGLFVAAVTPWAGQYYKKTNELITAELLERGLIFKQGKITHAYPHCHRCSTPLIYKAQEAWYLKVNEIRSQLIEQNKQINWVPSHFGEKRFVYNLENAPEWCISRSRYWGTPIPVWESEEGEQIVVGSVEELEKLSGIRLEDLHRPGIDEVVIKKDGKEFKRVKEVFDSWFEAGSMPYAQDHFPFENRPAFDRHFPAQFIIEYTGQLRGWFYALHVLSVALFNRPSFRNVVVTGVLAGTDGRKMSKSYGNYPDPKATMEKYGAESLRLYFLSSKVMAGEDVSISETEIRDCSRSLQVLHNSVKYWATYASLHAFESQGNVSEHILDRWLTARTEALIKTISSSLEEYDFMGATREIRPYIDDLSTWYIRRSRDRFVAGDGLAMQTLLANLSRLAPALAPILPFSAEQIWQVLGNTNSVHLQTFPEAELGVVAESQPLLDEMLLVRQVASTGNMLRSQAVISLRQPLKALYLSKVAISNPQLIEILAEELNVQAIKLEEAPAEMETRADIEGGYMALDTRLTPELKDLGRVRELTRLIQDVRKSSGLNVGQSAELSYNATEDDRRIVEQYVSELKQACYLSSVTFVENKEDLTDTGKDIWLKVSSAQS